MTAIDNEATTISNRFDEATEIVDNNSSATRENQIPENETSAADDKDNKNKTAKTIAGIAGGGAVLGGAASVFMNLSEDSTVEMTEGAAEEEEDNVVVAAEMVELPEVIVEALAPKHEETINATSSPDIHEEMEISSSETLYAEVSDPKPYKGDPTSASHSEHIETVTAHTAGKPEDDAFGSDIPIVSVGNESENDIQILGVTQDISTGYNVGHLSVDGEEVVVIDVDGDMVFDSMVVDLNHDGDTTPDEIIDIRQHSLSLEDFSAHSDIFNSLTSTGDTPDYLSEMVE